MKKPFNFSFFVSAALALVTVMPSCGKLGQDNRLIPRKDIVLTRSDMELVQEGNTLAFNYFRQVYEDRNFIISPFSLQRTLAIVQNGAQGKTQEEIASVIGENGADPESINSFMRSYTKQLLKVDPSTSLELADALLFETTISLKKNFRNTISSFYDAEVRNLDFLRSAGTSMSWINDWVKERTGGMVPYVVNQIPPLTISMVLSAMAFNGKWSSVFDPASTMYNYTFYLRDGTTSTVRMMFQNSTFEYAEDDLFKMLCLPYGNGAFQMVILLPHAVDFDLGTVDIQQWEGLLSKTHEEKLPVSIPKFSISTDLSLEETLSKMGMPTAFTGEADFSLVADTSNSLYLTQARQSCFIEVDESGTKAAAATQATFGVYTSPMPKYTFQANHPFLFAIMEKSTQGILLMGQFCGK